MSNTNPLNFTVEQVKAMLAAQSDIAKVMAYDGDAVQNRSELHGVAVWVCTGKHADIAIFLTRVDDEDVDNCPACGDSVLESFEIFPMWLTDKDPS